MSRSFPPRICGTLALALLALAFAGCVSQTPRADAPGESVPVQDATAAAEQTAASPPATNADDTTAAADANAPVAVVTDSTDVAAAADPRTQAEQDYDALYGAPYDPIADPTLPAPAQMPSSYDPWEPFNRRVYAFNDAVDRSIAIPLARAYVAAVPRPMRLGVSNFFNNLGQPVSAINALLQGKPAQAGQSLGRFAVNSTLGVAGLFDPATRFRIPNRSEDFGQTLGVWGWRNSRYLQLPLFGPRTVRDAFGLVGDGPLSPVRQVGSDEARYFLQGLQLVDLRTQLFALDSLREGATDEYALVRDSWVQRRNYQIFGDRLGEDDDSLPEYLRDDEANPTVPVDVMPIVPGSPIN